MYFNQDRLTGVNQLRPGTNIHVTGVCGVAMAQIAIELARRGFKVSGSDKEYYEPMSSLLKACSIECKQGYAAENLPAPCALVVIGNSVISKNAEVLSAEERKIPYAIFPQLLHELVIKGRRSVVVSGTHGKTTTSAMLVYVLEQLKLKPSYFFGGKSEQITAGLKVSDGGISVVEGDEYDSAFFAKKAKFHFYAPDTLILTSIEFDHADIYSSVDQIKAEFSALIAAMPSGSNIVGCVDDPGVKQFLSEINRTDLNIVSYGQDLSAKVKLEYKNGLNNLPAVQFLSTKGQSVSISLSIPGKFNLRNAVAACLALELEGVETFDKIPEVLLSFKGVARRQQVWLEEPVKLIEDFAHHPTAVRETLTALREWNPGKRIIAVFEPRSVTSRRRIFENDYISALSLADYVVLKNVEARMLDKAEDLFVVTEVCEKLRQIGIPALACESISEIEDSVLKFIQQNDLIVVMSNGSFGGLIEKLKARFLRSRNLQPGAA